MTARGTSYWPHDVLFSALLVLVLLSVVVALFLGAVGTAFREIGFSSTTVVLLLMATFLGSYVNIPVTTIETLSPVRREEFVNLFGIVYRMPLREYVERRTVIAVNLGGALIPTIISLYLLWKVPSAAIYAVLGMIIVATVTHLVSRPIRGVGIATPALLPPIVAALLAYFLPSGSPHIVAYVAGVLGTLIGADLSNLHVIPKLGAPIASIGGAGTFDGVFLSGVISALLA